MTIWSEFRQFIAKGNAVELAVGFIMGTAFGNIVNSITEGIIRPLVNIVAPDPTIGLMIGPFDVGAVIVACINFILTAAVVFFAIVKPINEIRRRLPRSES